MKKCMIKLWMGIFCFSFLFSIGIPFLAKADGVTHRTTTSYSVRIDAPGVGIYEEPKETASVVSNASFGEIYEMIETTTNHWIKIKGTNFEGYISSNEEVTIFEKVTKKIDRTMELRQQVVDYAMQFLGGRYVYGGNDPKTGVDCSGFTKYVMQHGGGVTLKRSSTQQSKEGKEIPVFKVKPGDLLFYGGTDYIDHVAIYIGNQQVIHASTPKTGIKISKWDYRAPVKAVNVLE